jgi:CxxC motif-containing protein
MATETRNFTCVQCPMGCPLTVTLVDGEVTEVTGNTCPRGAKYGRSEATHPERVVTSLVGVEGDFHPVSVKTAGPVPKESIGAVLDQISSTEIKLPVAIGDVVVSDVAGTGVDVVCTKSRER